jgi:hypothetical protein
MSIKKEPALKNISVIQLASESSSNNSDEDYIPPSLRKNSFDRLISKCNGSNAVKTIKRKVRKSAFVKRSSGKVRRNKRPKERIISNVVKIVL